MPLEIEYKAKVLSHADYIERLIELDAMPGKREVQRDYYYDNISDDMVNQDKSLRIRCVTEEGGFNQRFELCYKGQRIPGKVKTRPEFELPVIDFNVASEILTGIGYSLKMAFEKKRTHWYYKNCTVCLDTLPLIGPFIEVEGQEESTVLEVCNDLKIPVEIRQPSYARMLKAASDEAGIKRTEIFFCERGLINGEDRSSEFLHSLREGQIDIVANLNSGTGMVGEFIEQLIGYLRQEKYRVNFTNTGSFPEIMKSINKSLHNPSCKLICISGGDGTLRAAIEAVNGYGKPLMFIPGGTENLLSRELGYDRNLESYKRIFSSGKLKNLDIGKVNGISFTSVLGIGYDAETVELLAKSREGNITHADYVWPAWRAFWNHEIPEFEVEADGKKLFSGKGIMMVGNISRYATGMRILKDADFSDGMLDLCVMPCSNKQDILKYLLMSMVQLHTQFKEVIYIKCRHVKVKPISRNIATQIDGDPGPNLPLDIKIQPNAVQVLTA